MYKVYGIPNCNTVKKAINYLKGQAIEFEFVNFKKTSPTAQQISHWKKAFGDWPVNTKGPTFRKIKEQFELAPASKKTELLIENTSAIKRPIIEKDGAVIFFGFNPDEYGQRINKFTK